MSLRTAFPDDDPDLPPPSAQPTQAGPLRSRPRTAPRRQREARSAGWAREASVARESAAKSTSLAAAGGSGSAQDSAPGTSMSTSINAKMECDGAAGGTADTQRSTAATLDENAETAAEPVLLALSNPSAVRTFFDPWNSSSTGHQRAENRLSRSTSWRASRSLKLGEQYKAGLGGGEKRVADTVGAGSEEFGRDGRKENGGWESGSRGLRTGGQRSLLEAWGKSKASSTAKRSSQEEGKARCEELAEREADGRIAVDGLNIGPIDHKPTPSPPPKQIFANLCFYLNGSTAPLISDHKLKHLLAAHGAAHSIVLGRRTVTHVILGTGCGGGLAGSKLQREIAKTRGKSVRFVSAEWVIESVKAGRRLPESRFAPMSMAPKRQGSAAEMMSRAAKPSTPAPPRPPFG